MDELEISGKRYISSRRAAKEHHYHTDYIGQLIRAQKIEGTKVGRAWYVNEDSLRAYLAAESGTGVQLSSPAPAQVPATLVSPMLVAAPAYTTAPLAKTFQASALQERDLPIRITTRPEYPEASRETSLNARSSQSGLRYIASDEPLLPLLHKKSQIFTDEPIEQIPSRYHEAQSATHTDNKVAAQERYLKVTSPKLLSAAAAVVGIAVFAAAAYASVHVASVVVAGQEGTQTATFSQY